MIVVGWLVLGVLCGLLAHRVLGTARGGPGLSVALGAVGGLAGGAVGAWATGAAWSAVVDLQTMALALIGAVVLLALGRAFTAPDP